MKVIGLTGGIASGKSTVSNLIRSLGISVICADELARDVVQPGKPAYLKIVKTFGSKVLNTDRSINRPQLAARIFSSPQKRKALNKIVHPEVINETIKSIARLKKKKQKMVILDIPLLFEEGLDSLCNQVIVVYAPEIILAKRLAERNRLSKKEIQKRIASQMSIEEKKKRADHVIDNSGSLRKTKKQVEELLKNYLIS